MKAEVSQAEEKMKSGLRWKDETLDLWLGIAGTAIVLVVHYFLYSVIRRIRCIAELFPQSIWICQELGSGKWDLECFLVSADPGGNCCSSVSQRNAPKWNRGEDDRKYCDQFLCERIHRNWKPGFTEVVILLEPCFWIDTVAFVIGGLWAMLFLASDLVGDDTETTSEVFLWGQCHFTIITYFMLSAKIWIVLRQEVFQSGWD